MEEDRLEQKRKEVPHLWNLNEDPALTNVIVHFVEIGESRVGNGAAKADKLQIVLKGLSVSGSVKREHANETVSADSA